MKGIGFKVGLLFKSRNGKLCEDNFEYCKLKLLEFDETERNLLQAYVGIGYPWIAREKETTMLRAFKNEPEKLESTYNTKDNSSYEIASPLLQQITWENSPINAVDYIEREAKDDG